jgi:hypothetical protein
VPTNFHPIILAVPLPACIQHNALVYLPLTLILGFITQTSVIPQLLRYRDLALVLEKLEDISQSTCREAMDFRTGKFQLLIFAER